MTDAPFWLGGGRATVQLPDGGRYHERHVTWTRPDGETYSRPELGAAWIDPQPFMAWLPDEPNANVNNGRDACTYVPAGQSDGRVRPLCVPYAPALSLSCSLFLSLPSLMVSLSLTHLRPSFSPVLSSFLYL